MEFRLKRRIELVSVLAGALILSACAGAAPTPTAPPTQAPLPTATAEPVAEPATTEPTAEPTAEAVAAPASGAVVYTIVPEQSKASYEVEETFINQNNRLAVAIGVTSVVNGQITLDPQNPANSQVGEITVDISQLTSDSSRRDNAIRDRWLESGKYPLVKFVPTAIEGLPATYEMGSELTFKITGDMTVRDTTRSVTFDVTAKLDGDTLSGKATTEILMSDFAFEAPNIAGILRAEDLAKLAFEFVAKP